MQDQVDYKIIQKPIPEIKELLRNTVYGTTGLRYSHMDTDDKLDNVIAPDFHTLWLDDQLVAVAAYCKRLISSGEKSFDSYYIRYFSVHPEHQGKGLGKYLTLKLEEHYRREVTKSTVFYAYIEKKNLKSMAVSKHFKQEVLGEFKSVFFSRFAPNFNSKFEQISPIEYKTFASQHYKKHALYTSNKLGYKGNCFGIRDNGHLVAAIQANPVKWKIENLPGFSGWLSRNILHFIPMLGRLAPRNEFSFVAFEGLRTRENHEDKIKPLMESCLAQHKMYVGMSYYDTKDPIYIYLDAIKGMGLMGKIQNPPPVSFLCNFLNFEEADKKAFYENPKYLSCFDLT